MATEGPVHVDLAFKKLAAAWGVTAPGVRMRRAFESATLRCETLLALRRKRKFLWSNSDQLVAARVPKPGDRSTRRTVEHVHEEEIGLLMTAIVRSQVGLPAQTLMCNSARMFGWSWQVAEVRARMEDVLQGLLRAGTLVQDQDAIVLPGGQT